MMGAILRWLRSNDGTIPVAVRRARRVMARLHVWSTGTTIPRAMDNVIAANVHVPRPATVHRTGTQRRVVALSTYALGPRQTGGQLRGWHLNHAISSLPEVTVDAVSLTTDPGLHGSVQFGESYTEHRVMYSDDFYAAETRLRLLAGPTAITDVAAALMWQKNAEFVRIAGDLIRRADLVLLVQPYLIGATKFFNPEATIALDEHNDEFALKSEMIASNSAGAWLLDNVGQIEYRAIRESSLLTATTSEDLKDLARRHLPSAQMEVIPNGVDTAEIEFVTGHDRLRRSQALESELGLRTHHPTALFIGSGHRPNIEAGRRIIEFAEHTPEVEFVLAGRHSERLHRHRLPNNVHLLGVVDDELLDLLLAGCTIALNPMAAGSGSNLKLLSYLAAGLPVVSTYVGTRGIDADEAAVVCCELQEFPDAINSLIANSTRERSITGRQYVQDHCDWQAIGARFRALVEELMELP